MVKAAESRSLSKDMHLIMKRALSFASVIPPEKLQEYQGLLDSICRQSFDVYDRAIILESLHTAFGSVDWRIILNGVRVMNALIDAGCGLMFSEVQEGKHFDILQQMVFLSEYSNTDERVGRLVRGLARELRGKLIIKFDAVHPSGAVRDPPLSELDDEILASIPTPVLDTSSLDLL